MSLFEMPDIIDGILERLSLSSLEMLDKIELESERESRHYSEELQKSLAKLEEARLKRCTQDMNNKAELLFRKIGKYKSMLDKYTKDFEKIHCIETRSDHSKKISVYAQQIEILQNQLIKLTKKTGETLEELYVEINDMHKDIEELEIKNRELSDKLQCYEGFPANMREAQYCISDLKERIRNKEALFE